MFSAFKKGLIELLEEIEKSNVSSFLSVLKRFGEQTGNFSFPMEGYTIALDLKLFKTVENLRKKDRICQNLKIS